MGRTLNIEEAMGKGNNQRQNGDRANGGRPQQQNGKFQQQNGKFQQQGEANIETPTLFIGGLSYTSTVESMKEFFSACGEVQSARIVTDKETGNVNFFINLAPRIWICRIFRC